MQATCEVASLSQSSNAFNFALYRKVRVVLALG